MNNTLKKGLSKKKKEFPQKIIPCGREGPIFSIHLVCNIGFCTHLSVLYILKLFKDSSETVLYLLVLPVASSISQWIHSTLEKGISEKIFVNSLVLRISLVFALGQSTQSQNSNIAHVEQGLSYIIQNKIKYHFMKQTAVGTWNLYIDIMVLKSPAILQFSFMTTVSKCKKKLFTPPFYFV